jgi:hypothetical protein
VKVLLGYSCVQPDLLLLRLTSVVIDWIFFPVQFQVQAVGYKVRGLFLTGQPDGYLEQTLSPPRETNLSEVRGRTDYDCRLKLSDLSAMIHMFQHRNRLDSTSPKQNRR